MVALSLALLQLPTHFKKHPSLSHKPPRSRGPLIMTKKSKNKRKYETLEEEREARSVRAKNQNRLPNGRFCTLKDLDTKEFHQFLDLPLEIRFMIYEYLFATEKGTFQSCITAHAVERNEYWIAELYDEPDETYKPAPHHGLAAALPRPNH
jgi:hypothetical protein